jgi:SAM-dependent methyltransferase
MRDVTDIREQRLVFGEDARGYDAARPSYPAALIDLLVDLVGPAARVIDVGTGTAKGTRLLAARGMTGVGVEASPTMAAVAQSHLAAFPGWRVDVSDFEWWRPADGDAPADLVTSAQAWHWVQPQVGLWRAHQLLRSGGRLALWWNLCEPDTRPVRQDIDAVYAELAPSTTFCPTITDEGSPFDATPDGTAFTDAVTHLFPWTHTYTPTQLTALLATQSTHHLLPPPDLTRLLEAVTEVVNSHGPTYTHPYVTRLHLATRP